MVDILLKFIDITLKFCHLLKKINRPYNV